MEASERRYLELLIRRYPVLEKICAEIGEAYNTIVCSIENGGKILVAGNGGSAADAEHIVGEMMKSFRKKRKLQEDIQTKLIAVDRNMGEKLGKYLQGAITAIALDGHPALTTAYLNDCDPILGFAQQVYGYGKTGDILWAISTSGNSQNILYAAVTAKALGMNVIGLTGGSNNQLKYFADICIMVPETETFMVQELHLPIYHTLCLMLEEHFF